MVIKNIFKYTILYLIVLFFLTSFSNFCKAQKSGWQTVLEEVTGQTEYSQEIDKERGLIVIIAQIIAVFLSLLGIIFIILMIYAGYLWMTAGGNEEQVTKSKSIIRNSLIGIIIALAAYAITYFVIQRLTKATQQEESHRTGFYIQD